MLSIVRVWESQVEDSERDRSPQRAVHKRKRLVHASPCRQERGVRAVDQRRREEQERQGPLHLRAQPVSQQTGSFYPRSLNLIVERDPFYGLLGWYRGRVWCVRCCIVECVKLLPERKWHSQCHCHHDAQSGYCRRMSGYDSIWGSSSNRHFSVPSKTLAKMRVLSARGILRSERVPRMERTTKTEKKQRPNAAPSIASTSRLCWPAIPSGKTATIGSKRYGSAR